MKIHDRLEAFWHGEKPDVIPYTIYQWEWKDYQNDPAWQPMFNAGLGVTWHVTPFTTSYKGIEISESTFMVDGVEVRKQTITTPVGSVCQTWKHGWHSEYLLKTPDDYKVMTYIAERSSYTPDYSFYYDVQKDRPFIVPLLAVGRTPLQEIIVDLAGVENFALHLFEYPDQIRELYNAMLVNFSKKVEIVAGGPGSFVSNLENFTAEILGPDYYEEFLAPVYNKYFPLLHTAGKIVGTHYDGRTSCCAEQIARAPMDCIESLTAPPEGDLTYSEARAAWPDKLFWCNLSVGDYDLPAHEFRVKIEDSIMQAAPDKKHIAFEVSEQIPANWKESMPVVLDVLESIGHL